MNQETQFKSEHLRRVSRRWKDFHDGASHEPTVLYRFMHKSHCRCFSCAYSSPVEPARRTFEVVGPSGSDSRKGNK